MTINSNNEFTKENFPQSIRDFQPDIALVLGSGLGSFVDKVDIVEKVSYDQIEGLPVSKVPGHAGKFVFAKLGDKKLVIAQGRVHLYEGHSASTITSHVRAMQSLGISNIILTNAAGCINEKFKPGQWMQIVDHINFCGTTPLLGGPNFQDMSSTYEKDNISLFDNKACENGITLQKGVYISLLGPQYETPAEVKMLRTLGADAVGMSTTLEAIQARFLGVKVNAFSCLTNWAAGMEQEFLDHQEVLETGINAANILIDLLSKSLSELK